MRRPSFQFYPGDWRANANLRRCSHAERGVWMEVICLLHDSEEYGVLRWPLADIAQAAGCTTDELRALAAKGVLKGADAGERCAAFTFAPFHAGKEGHPVTLLPEQDGPVWFSSRMVREAHISKRRGVGTRFTETNQPTKPSQTRRIGDDIRDGEGDGPSSSSSTSTSNKEEKKPRGKAARRHLPEGWRPKPETVASLRAEFGWGGGDAERYIEAFADACRAKGYTYVDFEAAFRNCVRQDWPKLRGGKPAAAVEKITWE